jgi:hypothetical protein
LDTLTTSLHILKPFTLHCTPCICCGLSDRIMPGIDIISEHIFPSEVLQPENWMDSCIDLLWP